MIIRNEKDRTGWFKGNTPDPHSVDDGLESRSDHRLSCVELSVGNFLEKILLGTCGYR
jgi:hypothetical protein